MLASLHLGRAEGQRELGSPHTPRRREVALRETEENTSKHITALLSVNMASALSGASLLSSRG